MDPCATLRTILITDENAYTISPTMYNPYNYPGSRYTPTENSYVAKTYAAKTAVDKVTCKF